MNIVVLKENLKEGLDVLSRVVGDASSTLPILKNILLEGEDGRIKLSATNLESGIISYISGKNMEMGGITIPFLVLNSIIGNLQTQRINLISEDDILVIKTENYEARLKGIKKDDFPIIPRISNSKDSFEVESGILRDALNFVVSAAPSYDSRQELNGVLFDFQGGDLKLVATDSFRLAEKVVGRGKITTTAEMFKVIIPLKTIQEIIRIFRGENDKIRFLLNNSQISAENRNTQIISRIISGEFPDYQSIIPPKTETEVILKREELVNSLKLAGVFTDKLSEVKISIKEKVKNIEVESSSRMVGENHYFIPAEIKGAPLEIMFNWRFLLDGLKVLSSEDVLLGFNGDSKPAIIKSPKDETSFYILMPIKT